MRALITIIVGLMLSSFSFTTYALEIRKAFVNNESGDEDSKKCRIDDVSVKASIEAALRANRIEISQDSSTRPTFYSRVNAAEITTEVCMVSFHLQVYVVQRVDVQLTNERKKNVAAYVELCENGGSMSARKFDIQQRLNDRFKRIVDICISEISRMK